MNKDYKFIKDAYEGKHGSICQDWKDTILKHYPEFKQEEFKVGDWIWIKRPFSERLALIQIPKGYYGDAFGFNHGGNWTCHYNFSENSIVGYTSTKATTEEIKSHLMAEAEKRGFVEGVSCKSLLSGDIVTLTNTGAAYIPETHELHVKNCLVYRKGQWTETIKTITKEEAEKKLGMKII